MKSKSKGNGLVLVSLVFTMIVWGNIAPVTKLALEGFPPFTLATIRVGLSAAIFVIVLIVVKDEGWRIRRGDWPEVIFLGLMGNTVSIALQVVGVGHTTGVNGTLMLATGPVWIATLSVIWLRERMPALVIAGIVIAFAGTAVIIGVNPFSMQNIFSAATLPGDLMVLGCEVAWAIYSVFGRRTMRKYDPIPFTAWTTIVGAIGFIPLMGWELATSGSAVSPTLSSIGAAAFLAIFAALIGHLIWFWAISRVGAPKAGIFLFLLPLSGVLASMLILGERLTAGFILGLLMVLAGLVFVNRGEARAARLIKAAAGREEPRETFVKQ